MNWLPECWKIQLSRRHFPMRPRSGVGCSGLTVSAPRGFLYYHVHNRAAADQHIHSCCWAAQPGGASASPWKSSPSGQHRAGTLPHQPPPPAGHLVLAGKRRPLTWRVGQDEASVLSRPGEAALTHLTQRLRARFSAHP